jgi:protein-disulfide isomerase-like protein with CxxC motif
MLVGAAFKNITAVTVASYIPMRQITDIEALAKLTTEKGAAEAAATAEPEAAKQEVKEEEAVLEPADGFEDLFGGTAQS